MTPSDIWTHTDWIQAIQAAAATAVVIVALFQDRLRAWITSPKATIRLFSGIGTILPTTGNGKALYYHLHVENERPSFPLEDAEVYCVAFSRIACSGAFKMQKIIPLKLSWPFPRVAAYLDPSKEKKTNIVRSAQCDLGFLIPTGQEFCLALDIQSTAFDGRILPNEQVRIALEIRAKNFQSAKPTCFEIFWDGKWEEELILMANHLKITPVDWDLC